MTGISSKTNLLPPTPPSLPTLNSSHSAPAPSPGSPGPAGFIFSRTHARCPPPPPPPPRAGAADEAKPCSRRRAVAPALGPTSSAVETVAGGGLRPGRQRPTQRSWGRAASAGNARPAPSLLWAHQCPGESATLEASLPAWGGQGVGGHQPLTWPLGSQPCIPYPRAGSPPSSRPWCWGTKKAAWCQGALFLADAGP